MDLDVLVALLFRYAVTVVYFALLLFFKNGYAKSKASGLPNKFFLGFSFMFLAILVIFVGIDVYETLRSFGVVTFNLQTPFPGYEIAQNQEAVWIYLNF